MISITDVFIGRSLPKTEQKCRFGFIIVFFFFCIKFHFNKTLYYDKYHTYLY